MKASHIFCANQNWKPYSDNSGRLIPVRRSTRPSQWCIGDEKTRSYHVTQGVVPAAEEIFVFDLQYMIYYPLKFLAVINVLCLNGSNIPFNSSNHGYAFRTECLRVIGITPWAWIRMEGYKPLCFCVLQLDNDRRALALRSIVLNVSSFNKIKGQFVIVYLLLRRQVHIFYESTVVHEL